MRPYGERPKRRPGGMAHYAYMTFREQQQRRERDHLCRLEMWPQHRRRQRRQARASGKAEIAAQIAYGFADDVPGDGVFRCSPDCEFCNAPESAEDVFEAMRPLTRAANLLVMGWSPV